MTRILHYKINVFIMKSRATTRRWLRNGRKVKKRKTCGAYVPM